MELEILSFTPGGAALGKRLEMLLQKEGFTVRHTDLGRERQKEEATQKEVCPSSLTLEAWVRRGFGLPPAAKGKEKSGLFTETKAEPQSEERPKGLIFIGAAGIAVRSVAPYLNSKTRDPAVVVLDEKGQFAVSLLSGHIGGANRLARLIGRLLGAQPVITTATDVNGFLAVDEWAAERGMAVYPPGRIKMVSSRLLAGKPVSVAADYPVRGPLPQGLVPAAAEEAQLRITCRRPEEREKEDTALFLIPPVLTLGIGCRKGTPAEIIHGAVENALAQACVYPQALIQVASIDLKSEEPGILAYCKEKGLPFITYGAEELAAVPGEFTPSDFVKEAAGVDNVCERAAVLASGGRLILRKQAAAGVTVALAEAPYEIDFSAKEQL